MCGFEVDVEFEEREKEERQEGGRWLRGTSVNLIPSSLRVYDSGFWRWLFNVWRLVRRCVRSEGVSRSGGGLLLLMLVEVEVEAKTNHSLIG